MQVIAISIKVAALKFETLGFISSRILFLTNNFKLYYIRTDLIKI